MRPSFTFTVWRCNIVFSNIICDILKILVYSSVVPSNNSVEGLHYIINLTIGGHYFYFTHPTPPWPNSLYAPCCEFMVSDWM